MRYEINLVRMLRNTVTTILSIHRRDNVATLVH